MRKFLVLAALLVSCLMISVSAHAQFDLGRDVPEFVALCQKQDDPVSLAKCQGYFAGLLDFQRLAIQVLGIQGAMFCPSMIITPAYSIPNYLEWIKYNPMAQVGMPSASVYMYFREKMPCPDAPKP